MGRKPPNKHERERADHPVGNFRVSCVRQVLQKRLLGQFLNDLNVLLQAVGRIIHFPDSPRISNQALS